MAKKELSRLEWVKLAASRDEARPVLMALKVEADKIVATDGHRLHVAPRVPALAEGVWTSDLTAFEGNYPNWQMVVEEAAGPATLEVVDRVGMRAICAACIAAREITRRWERHVRLPTPEGPVYIDPVYLRDVLRGCSASMKIRAPHPLRAVRFDLDTGSTAIVMPLRREGDVGKDAERWDLSEFVKVLATKKEAAA